MSTVARNRQPKGLAIGGQFATEHRPEAEGLTLAPNTPDAPESVPAPVEGAEPDVRTKGHPDYEKKDIFDPCGRCGGLGGGAELGFVPAEAVTIDRQTGQVEHHYQVCFRCLGTKGKYVSQGQLDRREKARAYRARKAEEKAAERRAIMEGEIAEHEAALEAWSEEHSEVITALNTLEGDFGDSLRASLQANAALTPRQVETVLRIAAEKAAEPDPAPVVEGRGPITGVVKSKKWVDSAYGGSLKMLVLDDRGFTVWGTVPKDLGTDGLFPGDRVSFTGTCKASDDDETFGFFTRGTKSAVISPRVAAEDRITAPGSLTGEPVRVKVAYGKYEEYSNVPSGVEEVLDAAELFADDEVRDSVTRHLRGQARARAQEIREHGEERAAELRAERQAKEADSRWGDVFMDLPLKDAIEKQLPPAEGYRNFHIYLLDQDTAPLLEWLDDNHPRG